MGGGKGQAKSKPFIWSTCYIIYYLLFVRFFWLFLFV